MANIITIKRGSGVPATLLDGELAYNKTSNELYIGKEGASPVLINEKTDFGGGFPLVWKTIYGAANGVRIDTKLSSSDSSVFEVHLLANDFAITDTIPLQTVIQGRWVSGTGFQGISQLNYGNNLLGAVFMIISGTINVWVPFSGSAKTLHVGVRTSTGSDINFTIASATEPAGTSKTTATVTKLNSWNTLVDVPLTFSPSAHAHAWGDITSDVPATATRWPSWNEVTNKPTTFAPATHSHSYLPLSGGTITGTTTFQNNISIENSQLYFENPGTTGGWARGIYFRNLASIGWYGNGTTATYSFWGDSYTDTLGIRKYPGEVPRIGANAANALWYSGAATFSSNANGYLKLPNGFILQWGNISLASGTLSGSITFPVAFETACRSITGNWQTNTSHTEAFVVSFGAPTKTGATVTCVRSDGTISLIRIIRWMAVGI